MRKRSDWDLWNLALGTVMLAMFGAIIALWLTPDATVAAWLYGADDVAWTARAQP
jgi:hypothetical protein